MQFDFQNFPSTDIRKSKNIEQILDRLQKSSEHSGHPNNQQINFSNFGPIDQQNKSTDKSFTSQMFNKPKQGSVRESNQRPQFEYEQESSRDIRQITYLYSQDESFRFERSMSFEQENKDNVRFQRLKGLLTKAKSNNLDAFYRNLEQAANEKNEGNVVFESKSQFKEFTKNMRAEKRQQQAKFQAALQQKKATLKVITKDIKTNLFGNQAFKKKQANQFILPLQYLQQNNDDDDLDFFANNNNNIINEKPQDQYMQQKKETYKKEAQQFFNLDTQKQQPRSSKNLKRSLQTIREEKVTILDASMQEKKFQQLISNYNNMKGNYNTLMQQLKQTSTSQFQLMEEMQKIKHDYNKQQAKQKESRMSVGDQRRMKKEEKEKLKQLKEQHLATIKQEIHQIKATTDEKDQTYVKINDKIEQLEQLMRVAISQIQEEKQQNNFIPKVINYYNSSSNEQTPTPEEQQPYSEHANLSQSGSSILDMENSLQQAQLQNFATTDGVKRDKLPYSRVEKQSRVQKQLRVQRDSRVQRQFSAKKERPTSKSRKPSNIQSYENSIRRDGQQRNPTYIERNPQRQPPLNFIDDFSSPLQLDLSVDFNNCNNTSSQSHQQMFQIPFYPPDGSLEYLPLQLDQTETKNLRSILTQKSSILYQSFEFLITVRYTMQQDQTYPIVGSLRLANKCAIDLLDVFVIVYGPQGQNVEVTPAKVFQERLKYNTNLFFQVKLDKLCIKDNGFNVQVCYKTDSITKKKINFKALLPMIQMIRPQFCYQQNFMDSWHSFRNEIYIRPKKLNFKHIRNHEDLKLVLPFIHISEQDANTFSYGVMFRYPKSEVMFMLKIACYVNGKASVHLRADRNGDQQLKEELLNIINFLFLK